VVYRVRQEEIQILHVLPGMQDIDTILEEGFEEEEDEHLARETCRH